HRRALQFRSWALRQQRITSSKRPICNRGCGHGVQYRANVYSIQIISNSMDIREIAKRAKVSTDTVSRAINRVPTVDPQLAKRVWKVVQELGYYPNTQARGLVSGKSRIFG